MGNDSLSEPFEGPQALVSYNIYKERTVMLDLQLQAHFQHICLSKPVLTCSHCIAVKC